MELYEIKTSVTLNEEEINLIKSFQYKNGESIENFSEDDQKIIERLKTSGIIICKPYALNKIELSNYGLKILFCVRDKML